MGGMCGLGIVSWSPAMRAYLWVCRHHDLQESDIEIGIFSESFLTRAKLYLIFFVKTEHWIQLLHWITFLSCQWSWNYGWLARKNSSGVYMQKHVSVSLNHAWSQVHPSSTPSIPTPPAVLLTCSLFFPEACSTLKKFIISILPFGHSTVFLLIIQSVRFRSGSCIIASYK